MTWLRFFLPAVILAAGCASDGDSGTVTVSSLESLETGRRKAAARDFAGARDAFEAAATGGGLQPDFYCEALLQQADCESRLGDHEKALSLLDELAQGAPDLAKVNEMRSDVKARQAAARGKNQPANDAVPASAETP